MTQTYSSIKEAGVSPTRNLLWNPGQYTTSQQNGVFYTDASFNGTSGSVDKKCFANLGWNAASLGGVGSLEVSNFSDATTPNVVTNYSQQRVTISSFANAASDYIMYCTAFRAVDLKAEDPNFGTSLASPITLSFWIKSAVTGTFIVELSSQRMTRQADPRKYYRNSQSYTISSADTWEYKTVTFPAFTTEAGYETIDPLEGPQPPNYQFKDLYFALNFWFAAGTNYTSGTLNSANWTFTDDDTTRAVGQTNVTSGNIFIAAPQLEASPLASVFSVAPHKDLKNVFRAISKTPVRGGITLTGDASLTEKSHVLHPYGYWGGSTHNLSYLQTGKYFFNVDLNLADKDNMGSNRMYAADSGASSSIQVEADYADLEGYIRIDKSPSFDPGENRAQTLAFLDRGMTMSSIRFFEANNID